MNSLLASGRCTVHECVNHYFQNVLLSLMLVAAVQSQRKVPSDTGEEQERSSQHNDSKNPTQKVLNFTYLSTLYFKLLVILYLLH